MVTILGKKVVDSDFNGNDVVEVAICKLSVSSASDLPQIDGIAGLTLHEGSIAWDISTGDVYGLLQNGTWVKQPNGIMEV